MNDLDMLKLLGLQHVNNTREISAQQAQESAQQARKLDSIRGELQQLRLKQEREQGLPQCPACGGRLEGEFRKCKHCTSDLVWVEGHPCEPGQEAKLLEKLEQQREQARQAQQAELRKKAQKKICSKCGIRKQPSAFLGNQDQCAACVLGEDRVRSQEQKRNRALGALIGFNVTIMLIVALFAIFRGGPGMLHWGDFIIALGGGLVVGVAVSVAFAAP